MGPTGNVYFVKKIADPSLLLKTWIHPFKVIRLK